MLKLIKIAVTGGLSCGKSTACRFFKALGAYVVSSDEIVHQLLSPETTLGTQVINLIGPDVVVNHQIDRSLIAKKVFNHPQLLRSLENLIHPAVGQELNKLYNKINHETTVPLFVVEIPLLFEVQGDAFFKYDYSVAVIADEGLCKERYKEKTGQSDTDYTARSSQQLSQKEKAQLADYVIINNGTLEDLQQAVTNLFNLFVNQSPE